MEMMSSTQSAWTAEMDKRALHLFFAQELNNKATLLFERGLYKETTTALHDGLKLLIAINHQHYIEQHSIEDCGNCPSETTVKSLQRCSFCDDSGSLDNCIAFTEQTSFLVTKQFCSETASSDEMASNGDASRRNENLRNPRKRRRLSHAGDVRNGSTNKGYIYKQPIRIPLKGFCQCKRGYTSLLVVIVFNLAIVHHCSVIDEVPLDESKAQNIVFLYNLCLNLIRQAGAIGSSSPGATVSLSLSTSGRVSSTRCEMIIHNNLSQLYQMDGNYISMHKESLQNLLSTFMILVERGTRPGNGYSVDETRRINASNTDSIRRNGEVSALVLGILENLDPLILKNQCADAA